MRFSHFFIDRPIFASVIAVLIVLIGGFAYPSLPVAQYPEIAPPTIAVTASYPGASAEVLADTVAAPLEQEINGVEKMIYITSSSTGNGQVTINVVFQLGTNLDTAQVLVQNRVASALPRLPQSVQELGVQTRKNTPDILMAVFLTSPDGSHDVQYLSNYAGIQIRDKLLRLQGIGGINVFGVRGEAAADRQQPGRRHVHARLLDHRREPLARRRGCLVARHRLGRHLAEVLEQRRLLGPVLPLLEELLVHPVVGARAVAQEQVGEHLVDRQDAGDRRRGGQQGDHRGAHRGTSPLEWPDRMRRSKVSGGSLIPAHSSASRHLGRMPVQ